MRGLQVVLYLAVLLCVTKSALATCGSNGHYLLGSDNTLCVCESGYSGATCSSAYGTCTGATPSQVQADNFPKLVAATAAYTTNTLRIDLSGPFVVQRSYSALTFVNSSDATCNMAMNSGSFWAGSFDTPTCSDIFHVNLPWDHHTACGFQVDAAHTDEDSLAFVAQFTIDYVDMIGDLFNLSLTRETKVPFRIMISFPKRLEVTLVDVNVTAKVDIGVALTMDSFDPDTHQLTLEFTTILNWPNQLDTGYAADGVAWALQTPSNVGIIANGATSLAGIANTTFFMVSDQCPGDLNSICKQTVTFVVGLLNDALCTYDGYYNLTVALYTCRQDSTCSNSPISIGFNISTSSVCQEINLNPTVTGTLKAFDNLAHAGSSQTQFNLGSTGYFLVNTDAGVGNTVALKFYDICFSLNDGSHSTCLLSNGTAITTNVTGDGFHYYEAKLNVDNDGKAFSIYFSSVVFKVLPYTQTVYTFTARAYVTFTGNEGEKKRDVEFSWDSEIPDGQMSKFVKLGMNPAPVVANGNDKASTSADNISNIAYIAGGGGAGLVLIVFAVVGLAIHQKKRNAAKAIKAAVAAASVDNKA